MSKLEELIKRLCPDGVEYKTLGEVAQIKRGVRLIKKQLKTEGMYPVYQNSSIPLGYYDNYNCAENTTMIITAGAAGDILFSNKKFWAADDCFCFICDEFLDAKFLYYTLTSQQKAIYSKVRKASIPRLPRIVIENIKLPAPPLEVQREIVRVLDNFTFLTTELAAELAARQKQYEYYRDLLLTFKQDESTILNERTNELELSSTVRWMKLGDIAEVSDYVANGSFATIKSNVDYKRDTGYAILIRTVDFSNGFDRNNAVYIDKHAYEFLKKSKLYGGEIIINNIGAGVGTVFKCPDLGIPMSLAPNAIMVKTPNNDFYYYWLQSKHGQSAINKIIAKSAMPKFNKTGFRNILIPIPPLSEQRRIVSILDRFDTLCNDLTSGLPAEIALRQKQYEYYRDKLLTFKELKKEA